MNKRLSWSVIQEFFHGEWVALTDVEWEPRRALPTRAKVVSHSTSRADIVSNTNPKDESIILFVHPVIGLVQYDGIESRL